MLKYKPSKHVPLLYRGTRTPRDIAIRTTMLYNNNKNKKKWGAASNAPKK